MSSSTRAGALVLLALLGASTAGAQEPLIEGVAAHSSLPTSAAAAAIQEVTQTKDGRSLGTVFGDQVPGRRIAVLPLAEIGDPSLDHTARGKIFHLVDEQLGYGATDGESIDIPLWQRAASAYDSFGGAFLRRMEDGREYCVAFVGRPIKDRDEFLATITAGSLTGTPVKRTSSFPDAGIQRFLAYHEVGGHCADPTFSPSTGTDRTPLEAYEHSLAELRADIFATLAVSREDGNTSVARTMLDLRRAYSLQASAAPICNTPANYGAIYRTAPGIMAAIHWAETALSVPAGEPGRLQDSSLPDLLRQADRLRDQVKPSYEAFQAFERETNRLRETVGLADPRDLAALAIKSGIFTVSDRAWLDAGAAANRKIFGAPDEGDRKPLPVLRCQADTIIAASDGEHHTAPDQSTALPTSAGLGG